MQIILASASPRRKELLKLLVEEFLIHPAVGEEVFPKDSIPEDAVIILATQKAVEVSTKFPNELIIGSDTVVAIDGDILEKPKDTYHAFSMLKRLSGQTHFVYTGVAIVKNSEVLVSFCEITAVTFDVLTDDEINAYIKTGDPMDKAGAYGVQGIGAKFIKSLSGDYFTVMGLPINRLYHALLDIEPSLFKIR